MGALRDVPFCAEAITCEAMDVDDGIIRAEETMANVAVDINRLERNNKNSGYDVSTARGWMEHIEQTDGPLCGVGAYTVLRCDAIYSTHECQWKIWGMDFHSSRLCSSYRMLIESLYPELGASAASCGKETQIQTDNVITALLDEAAMSLLAEEPTKETPGNDLQVVQLVRTLMVTILWSPPKINTRFKTAKPVLRGHAAFAGPSRAQNSQDCSLSSPISACLAIPCDPTAKALRLLPRRYLDGDSAHSHLVGAGAKISSWCRIRRPLEEPA
eukprot:CAMPEP_0181139014 /NCGR_PEP_ID=MMETSP1071-20121207/34562_1 /TAXON_ID=35127 /ORGANISM="Thalassiosira sp., Strain NH16" /LENGTH=271 /DNA_ID=CAMNT_0023225905 /DNA_START=174 /DNA_END=985 /DNA_ORIENTATION=+